MKRHWVCLELKFEASKDFNVTMASSRATLSGNALLIAIFSTYKYSNDENNEKMRNNRGAFA